MQKLAHLANALHFLADRRSPAVKLLAKRHRNRILEVGAAHLEHAIKFCGLRKKRCLQFCQAFDVSLEPKDQRKAERRRVDIVG